MAPLPMLAGGALAAARSPCVLRAMRGGFLAPAAGDLSGFVYEEVFGAESYEASYGINFFSAPRSALLDLLICNKSGIKEPGAAR